jgi:hypothetical protein
VQIVHFVDGRLGLSTILEDWLLCHSHMVTEAFRVLETSQAGGLNSIKSQENY